MREPPTLEACLTRLRLLDDRLPELDADASIEELGLDSMLVMEWLWILEDDLDVRLDDRTFLEDIDATWSLRRLHALFVEQASQHRHGVVGQSS